MVYILLTFLFSFLLILAQKYKYNTGIKIPTYQTFYRLRQTTVLAHIFRYVGDLSGRQQQSLQSFLQLDHAAAVRLGSVESHTFIFLNNLHEGFVDIIPHRSRSANLHASNVSNADIHLAPQ